MSSNGILLPPRRPGLSEEQDRVRNAAYRVALGALFISPALILLPPRKLDFYTFGLGCTWVYCLNHVMEERGGGLFQRLSPNPNTTQQQRLRAEFEDEDLPPSEYIMKTIRDVWNQEGKMEKSKYAPPKEETSTDVVEVTSVLHNVLQLEAQKLREKAAELPEPHKSSPLIELPERNSTDPKPEPTGTVKENLRLLEEQKRKERDSGSLMSASDHTQPPWEETTPKKPPASEGETKPWWKVW